MSLFFLISHFSGFFYSILFLIRQDRFFSLFKKKIVFYQSQLYASTLPRLQFTVKIRVCLSVSLFLCLSVSLSLCLSVVLPFFGCRSLFLTLLFCLSISLCLLFFSLPSSVFYKLFYMFSLSLLSLSVFSYVKGHCTLCLI